MVQPAVLHLRCADQGFRRHTAHVHARTTQSPTLGDRHASAQIGALDRRGEACGTAPDDQQVKLAFVSRNSGRHIGPFELLLHTGTIPCFLDRPLNLIRRGFRPCHDPSLGVLVTYLDDLMDAGHRLERFRDGALAVVARHAPDLDGQFLCLVHRPPPEVLVVSGRIVAPKPVSLVR